MNDLSLFLLDIIQNSVRANSSMIRIHLMENKKKSTLLIQVEDNGAGMEKTILEKALDPFFTTRTTRSVGLGLSLLKQAAEATEGYFKIQSEPKQGTRLNALFHTDHIDMYPMGDLSATFMSLLSARKQYDLNIELESNEKSFDFSTKTVEDILQERLDLSFPDIYKWCSETIKNGVAGVFCSLDGFVADLSEF